MKFLASLLTLLFLALPARSQSTPSKEDWTKLAANRADFSPANPVQAGTQTQPGFTREFLQVQWRQGDPIDVYIVRPENAVKPPVILFLYSWPDDTDRFKSDAWCRAVTSHGFAAVGFVSALTGQRYHDRGWKHNFVTELPETLGESVHDVQLMLDYLATRKDLDIARAGIFGQGSGGTIALLAASVDSRLKAVDVIDPWGDWPIWFASSPVITESRRPEFLTPEFLNSVAPFDPATILPRLSGSALRLQQTDINPSTPLAAAKQIQSALPSTAKYVRYVNEDDYRDHAMKDGAILKWLQLKLSPAS